MIRRIDDEWDALRLEEARLHDHLNQRSLVSVLVAVSLAAGVLIIAVACLPSPMQPIERAVTWAPKSR